MLKKIYIPVFLTMLLFIFYEKALSQEAMFAVRISWSNIVPGEPSYGIVIVSSDYPKHKYKRHRYYVRRPHYRYYEEPVYRYYYRVPVYRYYEPVYYYKYKHDNGKHKGWYKKKFKHKWRYHDDD